MNFTVLFEKDVLNFSKGLSAIWSVISLDSMEQLSAFGYRVVIDQLQIGEEL